MPVVRSRASELLSVRQTPGTRYRKGSEPQQNLPARTPSYVAVITRSRKASQRPW